jgi:hypothetical protein
LRSGPAAYAGGSLAGPEAERLVERERVVSRVGDDHEAVDVEGVCCMPCRGDEEP